MRGGLERWKRGVESQGVRQALAYAFQGSCDSHVRTAAGVDALADYSATTAGVERFTVEAGIITIDRLDQTQLRRWVDGRDPLTDERRGRDLTSPDADLILDGTINAPKSYSIAALINPELAAEFEALQDRLRDRIITTWQSELNARRGAGGSIRESLHRIEVVELQHQRSRALDPHIHRHLWLNVKVLGEDGKWSNIDSRVAMKLHTVINAEGELAARTDPRWIRALARRGFTLEADGEIAQLAHAVRPLSRRSNQIERNRAMLLAHWHDEHPAQTPTPDVLQQIDRRAWATGRPSKPGDLNEEEWAELIRSELLEIDPRILEVRLPVAPRAVGLDDIDVPSLAAKAIVEADARSAASGGRFSLFDVRAGATRALVASGIVAERADVQAPLDEIISEALGHTIDLLANESSRPDHVKGFMSTVTAGLKVDLAAQFDALTAAGERVPTEEITAIASQVLEPDIALDDRQVAAAACIAGTDRLVSITGPAGAGKTTMLRVAKSALALRGARMVVVAPTKKAASVAGCEIGTTASSLHALLADYGWRWGRDEAGAETWRHLEVGEVDEATGILYRGPQRFPVSAGDRIVVDEAGMVDLHTAHALAAVATATGAGIAMVGDHLQAMPVGHSGAMASMTRRSTAVVGLTAVHRFRDPEYAALTLRMREPGSKEAALLVATELHERGHVHRVADQAQARDLMVEAYFRWATNHRRVALVTSTNEEADAINEAIQQRRLDLGQLALERIAIGQGEQRLLEGDVVQTRRNDKTADVENRAIWTVQRITADGLELVSIADSGERRTVSHDYAAGHVHLAYASTVHGIQGETTDAAIVGPGVNAAGLYVGMTRGRVHNEAIAIARTDAAARDAIADSMLRGVAEVSVEDSVRAARSELGRAARPVAPALWNDRERRPFGSVVDIERMLAVTLDREREARERLERMSVWMDAAERALIDFDADIGGRRAAGHGRTASEHPGDNHSGLLPSERYQARVSDHNDCARAYGELARTATDAAVERSLRMSQDARLLAAESFARESVSLTQRIGAVSRHQESSGISRLL